MRDGFTDELRELIYRADPSAQLIPEFVVTENEDIKDLRSEWDDADDLTGLESIVSGGVRLEGDDSGIVEQPNNDGAEITGLTRAAPLDAMIVRWNEQPMFRSLGSFTARLHPRPDNDEPKSVAFWRCQAFRVSRVVPERAQKDSLDAVPALVTLEPITQIVEVPAAGEVDGDVVFNFRDNELAFGGFIGMPPTYDGWIGTPLPDVPEFAAGNPTGLPNFASADTITVFKVWAIDENGAPAENVAWMANSTILDASSNPRYVFPGGEGFATSRSFRAPENGITSESIVVPEDSYNPVPDFRIGAISYTEAVVAFTGSGNHIDLGAAPTNDLECVVGGAKRGGAEITAEINDGSGWVEIADGDIIGVDNTPQGGEDLSGVAVQQSYDMRATLTPGSGGFTTPILRQLGVREVSVTPVYGTTIVTGASYSVDPVTHKGEISEPTIAILKTGERDYDDYASTLLSQNHIGDIQIRLFVGHPDPTLLARRNWLYLDAFEVEDYEAEDAAIIIRARSVMGRLRTQFPAFIETAPGEGEREVVEYSNQSITAVLADIVDGQVGLVGRYRGQIPESDDTVSNIIEEEDAKSAIDALAFLADQAVIASQGRVKGVQLGARDAVGGTPVEWFPMTDKVDDYISPGFEQRMDEVFVKWDYFEPEDAFLSEVRFFNGVALDKLGGSGLQSTQFLAEDVCRWIATEDHAIRVAERMAKARGVGLLLLRFKPLFPHPHLEPGDMIAMETDQFVGRSPLSDRELKGPLWVVGRVQEVRGFLDDQMITLWGYSWDDIKYSQEAITRIGFVRPEIINVDVAFVGNGTPRITGDTKGTGGVGAVVSDSIFASAATVDAQTPTATETSGEEAGTFQIDSTEEFAVGEEAYITLRAYENADGTGAVQRGPDTLKLRVRRPPFTVPSVSEKFSYVLGDGGTPTAVTLELELIDPDEVIVEFATKVNEAADPVAFTDPDEAGEAWTVDDTRPFGNLSITADLQSHEIQIGYAYKYNGQWVIVVVEADRDRIPEASLNATVGPEGLPICDIQGDDDALSHLWAFQKTPFADLAAAESAALAGDTAEGRVVEVSPTSATLATGETGYFAVVPCGATAGGGLRGQVKVAQTGEREAPEPTVFIETAEWRQVWTGTATAYQYVVSGVIYGAAATGVQIAYTSSEGSFSAILDGGDATANPARGFGVILAASGDYDGSATPRNFTASVANLVVTITGCTGEGQVADGPSKTINVAAPDEIFTQPGPTFQVANKQLKVSPEYTTSNGALDFANGANQRLNCSGTTTISATGVENGEAISLVIDNSGGHTVSWSGITTTLSIGTGVYLVTIKRSGGTTYAGGGQAV